ncbi:MAG: DUF551 domain-containing protein [Oscillospiraceae bacterium]|nr:DUF551 domain-containing protein [Oscillospiraceae bacterium]
MCDYNDMERVNLSELIKSLRICGDWKQQTRLAGSDRCEGCKYRVDGDCKSFKGDKELLLNEAADAIESLDRFLGIAENCYNELEYNQPRWISVAERLPEDGEYVLAYSESDGLMLVEARHRFSAWEVTHWMPLPEPPKEERIYNSMKRGLEQAINGECRSVTLTTPVMEYPQVPGITPTLITPKEDEA